jgi:hypothetical protein
MQPSLSLPSRGFDRIPAFNSRRKSLVAVSEGMYILFVPGFTILAFLIGTGFAFMAMSAKQEPTDDEGAADVEEAAH